MIHVIGIRIVNADIYDHLSTAGLFLHRPSDKFSTKTTVLYKDGQFLDLDQSIPHAPVIYLKRKDKDVFEDLINKTVGCLGKENIFGASKRLADAVLKLHIGYRSAKIKKTIYEIISDHSEINVTIYIGIPFMRVVMSDNIEPFMTRWRIGRFSSGMAVESAYQKECFSNKLDTMPLDANISEDSYFIIRKDPSKHRLLNSAADQLLETKIKDYYLDMITNPMVESFRECLSTDQSLPGALGASIFDLDTLFSLDRLQISTSFENFGKRSFILLDNCADFLPDNMEILEARYSKVQRLLDGKPLNSNMSIDKSIIIYTNFLNKAQLSERHGRISDSFLLAIMAVEIILGTDDNPQKQDQPTKLTTSRAALIYAMRYKIEYKEAKKRMDGLYNARSRYVHQGREITVEKLQVVWEFTECILESLLQVRSNFDSFDNEFLSNYWYPRLDHLISGAKIGQRSSDETYAELGLHFPTSYLDS